MITNNISHDVKVKLAEADMTQNDLAEKIGTTQQYLNRVVKQKTLVNKTFLRMMEELGYDVTLTYTPREKN